MLIIDTGYSDKLRLSFAERGSHCRNKNQPPGTSRLLFTMKFPKALAIIYGVFIFIMAVAAPIEGLPSRCDVETHGVSALVICKFDADVSQLGNDFEVNHLDTNTSDSRPETVLYYKAFENPPCTSRSGYELQGKVSSTVTVYIPVVSQKHAGIYYCAMIPSQQNEIQFCNLTLTDNLVDVPAPVSINNEIDTSKESSQRGDDMLTWEVILGIILAVAVPFTIVIIFIVIKKRRTAKKRNSSDSTDSSSTPLSP